MNKKDVLISTNLQKILHFLLSRPLENFLETEIQRITGLSKSGVNYALRNLVKTDYIFRHKRGKAYFYQLRRANVIVKQLKIIETLTCLNGMLGKLEPVCSKIILFGSSSRGEDTPDSDVDLLIVSRSKGLVIEQIKKSKTKREIQPIICTNVELLEKKKTDPVFYEQVIQGITLWKGTENEF
ncbi:MAG: nucleotidyltransferase domain-containing protein [Candidatus Omnitrophota bacterium]